MENLDKLLSLTTVMQRKRELYKSDINFIESASDLSSDRTIEALEQFTCVIFKPDGLVAGSVEPSLSFLAANGFIPVSWKSFTYDRNMIRSAWRYQINIATPERLRVVDFLLTSGKSAYLLLRYDRPIDSASALLSSLKGPAEVAQRPPNCFRSVLGDHNTFLNKVHVPDDGADMLREMSIYFDRNERLQILAAIGGKTPARSSIPDWVVQHTTRDLAIEGSVEGLFASLQSSNLVSQERRELEGAIRHALCTGQLPMTTIDLLLSQQKLFQRWDLAIFLTQFVQPNREGVGKIL